MGQSANFKLDAPMSRIVLLGARATSETVARFAAEHGIDLAVFSAPRQTDLATFDGIPLHERMASLGFPVSFTNDIRQLDGGPYQLAGPGAILLSLSCPYGVDEELVDLYGGRAVNVHGTPLPEYRGGGGFSWPILAGDRRGSVSIHLMIPGQRDDGPLLLQQAFNYPPDLRYPRDYEACLDRRTEGPLRSFLEGLRRGESFEARPQDDNASTFMPRLHTPSQAYIDWSWRGDLIERFVLAFSHPYPGAMTFGRDGQVARMFDCRFDPAFALPHPFINGIVFRETEGRCFIACEGGILIVDEDDMKSGQPPTIGDRLHTPHELLDKALAFHPSYSADGISDPG